MIAVRLVQSFDLSRSLSAFMSIVQVGAILLLHSILATELTAHDYGSWATVSAALAILAIVAQMGLPDLLTKETAIGKTKSAGHVWSTWSGFDQMIFPSLAAAMIGAAILLPNLPGTPWQGVMIFVLLAHLPCLAIISLRAGAIRGMGRGNSAHFLTNILATLTTIGCILLLLSVGIEISVNTAFSISLISLALPLALTQYLRDTLAPAPRLAYPLAQEARKALRRASLPMAGIAGLGILNSQADVLMLSWLADAQSAGVYQIAIQTAIVLAVVRSQMGLMVSGRIATYWDQKDTRSIQTTSGSVAVLSTFISLVGFFLSLTHGEALLVSLFSEHASAALLPLNLVCFAWVIASVFGLPGYCLMMSGHQRITLRASVISFAINILLNPILIPLFGVVGAAITLLMSVCFWHIYLWIEVKRRLNLDCSIIAIVRST